jgi:chromosome partitioning protein
VQDEVRSHMPGQVFSTVIPRNVRLSEAPSHGKPVLLYDAHSKGAIAYLHLADEILRRRQADCPAPPGSSATECHAAPELPGGMDE